MWTFETGPLSLSIYSLHSCCGVNQYFISFYDQIIFHCGYTTIYPFIDRTFGLFPFWTIVNTASHASISFNTLFQFTQFISRSGIACSYGYSVLNFIRKCQSIFHRTEPYYNSTAMYKRYQFFNILANISFPFI